MADIKRLNYFTSQFLVAKDFTDEQSYHLGMRRRLNRVLHSFGIADGLTVTRSSTTQIQVGIGTAIDKNGQELVFQDIQTYTLVTAGNNLDVYLTLGYQEVFDPADHYTQSGLDTFNRTTERPLLHDGTAVPPTDGSVIVLARIHLGATGTIESDGSIDSSVRILAGSRIAPQAVGTTQLADGGITLVKLAAEAQPHPATAAQVDSQTGPNSIVTQINGGTGIIANARLERVMVTGTASFANLQFNQEQFSDLIDPGFGGGPVGVELAFDDLSQANITLSGDTGYARSILVRSEVDRTTGRFRVFAMRNVTGTAGGAHVRWFATKLQTAPDTTVQVGVTVTPATVSLAGNVTQPFTATVTNATNSGVTWSITESSTGGTLVASGTTATYTSPGLSGTYHVVATSVADTTKSATAVITVTAAIAVNISQTAANLLTGAQLGLSASVINTTNLGINWTTTGGTLSVATGGSTTFTAPTAPGTYTVTATSAADNTKKAICTMTVAAVSISVSADQNPIPGTGSTVVRASISPSFADQNATWTLSGSGSLSTNRGPTTTYSAPGLGGQFTVTGTSVADPTKAQSVTITANNVGPSPSPSPSPPGKLQVSENIAVEGIAADDAAPAATDKQKGKARTFLAPQKRPKPTGDGGKDA